MKACYQMPRSRWIGEVSGVPSGGSVRRRRHILGIRYDVAKATGRGNDRNVLLINVRQDQSHDEKQWPGDCKTHDAFS